MKYIYAGLLSLFVVHVGDASDSRCPLTLSNSTLLGLSKGVSISPTEEISLSLSKKSGNKQAHQKDFGKLQKQIGENKSVGRLDKPTNNKTSVCHYTLDKTKTEKTYQKVLSKFRIKGGDISEIMLDLTPNNQKKKNVYARTGTATKQAPPLPPKPSKYCPSTLSYENLKALSGGNPVTIQGRSLRFLNKGDKKGMLDRVVPDKGATLFKDETMSSSEEACTYEITTEDKITTPDGKRRVIILSDTNIGLPQTTSTQGQSSQGVPAA